jgi:hypothetical protein
MKRRLLAVLGFATGVLAGSVVLRRRFGKRRDRVEVYFDDGGMVSYVDGSVEASPLLDAARDALNAARSSR